MTNKTKTKVKELLELNSHGRKMFHADERIEEIADRFPEEYSNEQEYIEFQEEIDKMIFN